MHSLSLPLLRLQISDCEASRSLSKECHASGSRCHVDGIETRIYHKKVKEANGDELFEKILWGMVLVVVRRHGASESAARRTITQRRILHSTVAARR